MTEKRFYIQCDEYNAWSVWEKDKDVVVFDLLKYDAEVVCKALNELSDENEQLKEHQRTLEAKIVRLKDRVKTFEKHYSLKDIERYQKMGNCNCIHSKRLKK